MAGRPIRHAPRRARPVVDDAIVQALLPPHRQPQAEDRELALVNAQRWHAARFSPEVVRAWLRAGAHPHEVELVTALFTEGVSAARADEVVTHPDTGERMTVLDLARREHRAFHPRVLRGALDAAGVACDQRDFGWWATGSA